MELKMRLRTFETIWRVCVIILDQHFALSFCAHKVMFIVTGYKIQNYSKRCVFPQLPPPCKPLPRSHFTGPLVPWGCHPDRCWACHQIRQVLVWQVLVSAVTSFQRVNTMVRSMESPVGSSWPVLNPGNLPGRNFICYFEGWTWME